MVIALGALSVLGLFGLSGMIGQRPKTSASTAEKQPQLKMFYNEQTRWVFAEQRGKNPDELGRYAYCGHSVTDWRGLQTQKGSLC
jgi:hypothetical protein